MSTDDRVDQLLVAIEASALRAGLVEQTGGKVWIEVCVGNAPLFSFACEPGKRPRAESLSGSVTVHVWSEANHLERVDFNCENPQQAQLIVRSLEACFEKSYNEFVSRAD